MKFDNRSMKFGDKLVALFVLACVLVASVAAQGGRTASVRIKDFQFEPKQITVKAGTTVKWTNDEGSHTVTADNDSFSSPTLTAGKTYSRRFTKPGTYAYHCSFHGSAGGGDMSGTVVVTK